MYECRVYSHPLPEECRWQLKYIADARKTLNQLTRQDVNPYYAHTKGYEDGRDHQHPVGRRSTTPVQHVCMSIRLGREWYRGYRGYTGYRRYALPCEKKDTKRRDGSYTHA